jgi:UDP-glucose-4-epimerase GalE
LTLILTVCYRNAFARADALWRRAPRAFVVEGVLSVVLVTGGAGYIGSHAVKALVAAGARVVVYDDLSAGHREAVEAVAVAMRGADGGVPLVEGDIRDTASVEQTLRAHGVDAVMHFAAWLSVGDSVRDPAGYYRNNVVGALSVLEAMAAAGVPRFIFSSTCAVFGHPEETPIPETHPTRPINAYGQTKLAIEHALPHFETAYGLRWVALRYFNAAGADPDGLLGEDHDPEIHLIPRALAAAAGVGQLEVFGDDYDTPDGTCLRDYIHVADLADAHVRALRWLEDGRPSNTFNLGNGRAHSVLEVIRTVEDVTGSPVPFRFAARRPGDPAALFASNARIRDVLGWRPRHAELRTIVETAWRWHRGHPNGYSSRS